MVKKTTASTFISGTNDANSVLNSTAFIQEIEIDLIDSDEENEYLFGYNEVSEIAKSIKEVGFKSVVTVYKKENGRYQCLSGNSRIRACKELKMDKIRCEIVEAPKSDDEKDLVLIKLNTQRVNRPLYLARQIKRAEEIYRNQGLKGAELEEKICDAFNIKRSQMFEYKKINNIHPILQDLCAVDGVPYSGITKVSEEIPEDKLREFHDKVVDYCKNNSYIDGPKIGLIMKSLKEEYIEEEVEKTAKKVDVNKVLKKLDTIDMEKEIKIKKKEKESIKEKALMYIEYLNKVVEECDKK